MIETNVCIYNLRPPSLFHVKILKSAFSNSFIHKILLLSKSKFCVMDTIPVVCFNITLCNISILYASTSEFYHSTF